MKLLLISPRGSFLSRNKEFNEFWNSSRALQTYRKYWSGIGSNLALIAALTPPEVDVEIIDENMEEIDYNKKYDLWG